MAHPQYRANAVNVTGGEGQSVEKKFKEKYPNATIQYDNTANEKYFDLLKVKLASGTAADVIFHQGIANLVSYAKAGYLADLSDQPWVSDMLDLSVPYTTYQRKVYAAPNEVSGWGIWYNKKIFTDLNIALPKTWDELMAICELLKSRGITPFVGGFKDSWTANGYFDAVAAAFVGPDYAVQVAKGEKKFNSPEFAAIFTAFQTLFEKDYYNKNSLSIGWDQARVEFQKGNIGMMVMGSWLPGSVHDANMEVGFMPVPGPTKNIYVTSAVGAVKSVNAKTKYPQQAKDLVAIMSSKEAVNALNKNSVMSPFKSFVVEQTLTGNKEYADALKKFPTAVQPDTFIAGSVVPALGDIALKIAAGKKFDPSDLDLLDQYTKRDRDTIVITQ